MTYGHRMEVSVYHDEAAKDRAEPTEVHTFDGSVGDLRDGLRSLAAAVQDGEIWVVAYKASAREESP